MMSSIQQIKQQVGILRFMDRIGAKWKWVPHDDEVKVFCPFCEDEFSKKPAGRANTTKDLYFCFNCGAGGDIIKLAKVYLETTSLPEALEWLEVEFGVGI